MRRKGETRGFNGAEGPSGSSTTSSPPEKAGKPLYGVTPFIGGAFFYKKMPKIGELLDLRENIHSMSLLGRFMNVFTPDRRISSNFDCFLMILFENVTKIGQLCTLIVHSTLVRKG